MSTMHVVYAQEKVPEEFTKSIFLAGPSPRKKKDLNWRPEALITLEKMGYDGVVFVPLPRNGEWCKNYEDQVEWELRHLSMADAVVFWIPRDKQKLPAFTTNVEYGMFFDSGKAILGYPSDAHRMRYLAYIGEQEHVPMTTTLKDTLHLALAHIGSGAKRSGGERMVPIHIWNLPHFQQWLMAQKNAGNRLDDARLLWSCRVGPTKAFTFVYALHVNVYVRSENRNKTNEFIIARPDIATIVAYQKHENFMDTKIVLIREFRSPARTSDGFIHELPGGSSRKLDEDPFVTAVHELSEETGIHIDPVRLQKIGSRQLCSTLSTHQAHVFAFEITEGELGILRKEQTEGVAHGVLEDSERTYVEVHRLGDLLDSTSNIVDWSMLGMILTTING